MMMSTHIMEAPKTHAVPLSTVMTQPRSSLDNPAVVTSMLGDIQAVQPKESKMAWTVVQSARFLRFVKSEVRHSRNATISALTTYLRSQQ